MAKSQALATPREHDSARSDEPLLVNTPERIPHLKRRLVLTELWDQYLAIIYDVWWDRPREFHVFRIIWYHTLRGKALRVGQIAKLSRVPRQTLQQGENGMLPKMVRDGWLARVGRSQYCITNKLLLATYDDNPSSTSTSAANVLAKLVIQAGEKLKAILAEERRAAGKKKPRQRIK